MPSECENEIWHQKTRITGLPGPSGEEITIVGPSMWSQFTGVVKHNFGLILFIQQTCQNLATFLSLI